MQFVLLTVRPLIPLQPFAVAASSLCHGCKTWQVSVCACARRQFSNNEDNWCIAERKTHVGVVWSHLCRAGARWCQDCGCGKSDHVVVVGFQGQWKPQHSLDWVINGSLLCFHVSMVTMVHRKLSALSPPHGFKYIIALAKESIRIWWCCEMWFYANTDCFQNSIFFIRGYGRLS